MKAKIREIFFVIKTSRRLRNAREVLMAHFFGKPLPPFELGGKTTLHHTSGRDALYLLGEILYGRCYTREGFYSPKSGDVVFDVGANIGTFVLYLQSLGEPIRVFAFEPAPSAFEVLTKNVRENNLGGCVRTFPIALGKEAGTMEMLVTANMGHSSFYEGDHMVDARKVSVSVVGLPKIMEEEGVERIDLLKIDIEGAEKVLFEGMTDLAWNCVRRVTMETHDKISPGVHASCLETLQSQGFYIHSEASERGLGYINALRKE